MNDDFTSIFVKRKLFVLKEKIRSFIDFFLVLN